jgi:putative tryptophan/tyrosine transport system substrate-binding protein
MTGCAATHSRTYEGNPAVTISRRVLARVLGAGAALPWALAAFPSLQAQAKTARVGVLEAWSPTAFPNRLQAFRDGLAELGHIEGRTLAIAYRSAHGDVTALPTLAAELAKLEVDVIFAATTATALSARRATSRIPIVIAVVADPVGAGLIASLARPGGNVTGLTTGNTQIVPKRLQFLREITGGAPKRIGLVMNPSDASNVIVRNAAEAEARALGIALTTFEATDRAGLAAAFPRMAAERIDALLVAAGQLMDSEAKLIAESAAQHRLPAIYSAPEFVEAGGLMSYSASFTDNFRRAAAYVDRILKGASPGDLPVEQASTFEFVVNLKAAKALGLQVPPSFFVQATRVIE